jgi:predicted metal-binding protein
MSDAVKIGIIICDRYRNCAGGKCFKALMKREGAFSLYKNKDVELAGYTTCGGCLGGNIEYAPEEMKKNGVEIIHFATGFVVGYPPCPYIDYFKSYIEKKFGIEVVIGTHPIPEKYYTVHEKLGTWNEPEWKEKLRYVICDEEKRREYD